MQQLDMRWAYLSAAVIDKTLKKKESSRDIGRFGNGQPALLSTVNEGARSNEGKDGYAHR